MTCSSASGRSDSVPTPCPSLSPWFQGIISAFMPVHNRRFAAAALLMTDRLLTQGLLAAASPFGATPLVTLLKKGSLSRVPPGTLRFGAIVSGLSRKWAKWPWFRGPRSPPQGESQPAAALARSPRAFNPAAARLNRAIRSTL